MSGRGGFGLVVILELFRGLALAWGECWEMVLLLWGWGEMEIIGEGSLSWLWRGKWSERELERMSGL